MKNLRVRMTIMIVLAVLLSSGLLSLISFLRARDTMASQLEEGYSVAADKYAQELTAWMNTQATIVDTLSVDVTLSKIYEKDYDTFHQYLTDCLSRLNYDGYIYDIYFTYPDNSMVCGSDFIPDGSMDYVHDRDWYKVAGETGELFYSTPYKDSDSSYSIITISKAVYEGDKVQGVLAIDVFVDTVIQIVSEADVAENGYAFLVDQNMGMIAHPDPAYAYDDVPLGVLEVHDAPYEKVVENILTDSGETVYIKDYDGVTRAFVISRMDNTGWHVGIATDRDELLRSVSGLIRGFLVAALISVLIGIAISIFLARSLNKLSIQEREQENLELMKKTNKVIVRSLASAIDAKDRYTSGHSQRVAEYAVELARRMGMSADDLEIVYYAGILHDIGKISVSEEVINKPGKLTEDEFDLIRIHPVSGYHILQGIYEDERVGYGAKYHHERYNGTGYPNGLAGKDIPKIARIIAVADAYDAMASDRSYRNVLPQATVRDEILRGKGTQFDPEIADIMIQMIDEDTAYKNRQTEDDVQNILAVDDDKGSLIILERALRDMKGVRVLSAQNREDALKILESNDISLVILDLYMPDTDGFRLLEEIREKKNIPAILLTGDKTMEVIKKIREHGVDDYITKPLSGAITRETVYSILRKKRYQTVEE